MKGSSIPKHPNLIVIVIPISRVKDYFVIDFIGGTVVYLFVKKLTLSHWLALGGSYFGAYLLYKSLKLYRSILAAHRETVMPVASIIREKHDAPPSPIE
ncbi:hypothetical protein [Paenibacillus marinisediminis]